MTEREIFIAARHRTNEQARIAFLDAVCAGDTDLQRRVLSLLQEHDQIGSFLESPAFAVPSAGEERPGTAIGPYRLREQIGEGGMGLVFAAEQTQPVRRIVALKVIKPGMDTRQVVARFEAERQALALMDHPNIAQVFDGGVTPSGRPYFVMELVKGGSITQFCDAGRLTTRERLRLFVAVCQAVQHAHQKGIIHRDIKPSNVLVTDKDGSPTPKVIDFGVAKATDRKLSEQTVCTQNSQFIGTPLYMSPEQAGLSGLDIDTRTDVYALGVLLYELLTGTTPFDGDRLRRADVDEIRRIIREEEPVRPSTRVTTLGPASRTASDQRRSDPKRLSRALRGELDWVVMKCLAKDRDRRYETATALAQDVLRYLNDEPVQACPPAAIYRLGKFIRRNQVILTATALVALALVLGAAVSIWQAVRATSAEGVARNAEGKWAEEADRAQRQYAEAEAQRQQAELYLRIALLVAARKESLRPVGQWMQEKGRDLEGLLRIAHRCVTEEPEVEEGWKLLAVAYEATNRHDEALAHFTQAVLDRPNSAPAHNRLAWFLVMCPDANLRDPKRAVDRARRAVSIVEDNQWYWNTLGVAYYRTGDFDNAIKALKHSESLGWDDGYNSFFLAMAHWRLGDPHEARRRYALALETQKPALPFCGTELRRIREEAEQVMAKP